MAIPVHNCNYKFSLNESKGKVKITQILLINEPWNILSYYCSKCNEQLEMIYFDCNDDGSGYYHKCDICQRVFCSECYYNNNDTD